MTDSSPSPSSAAGPRTSATAPPAHIAIIMDGNGRWAQGEGDARLVGHRAGAKTVREITTYARELGVRYLTLYAFSSENWGRPEDEVDGLMALLSEYLVEERETLLNNDIELRAIGDLQRLPQPVQVLLREVRKATEGLGGMRLTLSLSYGSRDEILQAVRALAQRAAAGEIDASDIDADLFACELFTADMPDPDLLIRTSGEQRISNFLLWQLAYSELYFTPTPWPAFGKADLEAAIADYHKRQRRYGLTGAQMGTTGVPETILKGAGDGSEKEVTDPGRNPVRRR